MKPGDHVVFYSGKATFEKKRDPLHKFTALGVVKDKEAYPYTMSIASASPSKEETWETWRRDINFLQPFKEVEIRPLLPHLHFIKKKEAWGLFVRRGFFSIPKEDYLTIAEAMLA